MVFVIARTAFGPPERVLAGFLPTRTREPESAKCVKSYPAQYLRDSGLPELTGFYNKSAAAWHIVCTRCSDSNSHTASIIDVFDFSNICVLTPRASPGRPWAIRLVKVVGELFS